MKFFFAVLILVQSASYAQSPSDYYFEIPAYPSSYTAGTVAARMVDALGFRYYWGTEGLTAEDLAYQPSLEARTSAETIDHIYELSKVLVNATKQLPNDFTKSEGEVLAFEEKRTQTLKNIQEASEILRESTNDDLELYKIVFISDNGRTEYPFWNQLNGPLADAIWHVGQVVSFRRATGHPFNSNVSVLRGKLKEEK
ncbi:hypothetical protein N7E81_03575 [Reichenbachiella carrageenanivorans]|uniref:DinB superfamily protein n=1 Tax=Reichenbachiella carrageenanivorans TaxID=2979869 RepID=A0ABY6D8H1_9BACT|nr:hypothetical protein [Reichenbachiella carrageenanivorans]UXX80180.1 hypothetical protein N7E81_03575 [Reichenbachiella carrageenanivorans]